MPTPEPYLHRKRPSIIQQDPVWFCDKQREIIELVRDNPEVYAPSCRSSGKSFTAAHVALWFLLSFPRGGP
ncbi:MAG TPA: hypothetical protein VLA19_27535 [Herpetosiphonaceae bacterium]|nr:hypothetical protein [Herpetosiphonaceae bacterium]